MIKILDKNEFINACHTMQIPCEFDIDVLYLVYLNSSNAIQALNDENILSIASYNPFELINYIIGEYVYIFTNIDETKKKEYIEKENNEFIISSIVVDKFISLTVFKFKQTQYANPYIPQISSLALYLNLMMNILEKYKKNDPRTTLIIDLLMKSVTISKCVLNQIVNGFYTEAFSLWRTLHECECTLMLLDKYGDVAIKSYLKHFNYGLAYSHAVSDKNKEDEIFAQIKDEMKSHELKSKDMKKFIEYGWLYAIPGVDQLIFKLNFRDGLQALAGLSSYNQVYLQSSEIIHSTPMLIYSNKQYYYFVALLNLYESFFRISKIFDKTIIQKIEKEQYDRYQIMRNVYFNQLLVLHESEKKRFESFIHQ